MNTHPFRWVIAFLALSLMGLALIPRLSVDLLPKAQEPSLSISYQLPQSAPDVVEQSVTAPLENMLSALEGVKKIKSVSNYNSGNIVLEFDKNEDLDFKKFEVNALLRRAYPQLPPSLSYPTVERGGNTNSKTQRKMLLLYSINAPFAAYQIQKTAQDILQVPLRSLEEVEEVSFQGGQPLGITVEFSQERLQALGLSKTRLIHTLQEATQTQYLGQQRNAAGQYFFIKNEKTLSSLRDWEQLPLPSTDSLLQNVTLRLKDVAKVYFEEAEAQSYFRINGLNSVSMAVYARSGSNALALTAEIKQKLQQLQQNLPKGYQLLLEYDDSEYLAKELQKIYQRTGLSIIILMLFVLLSYRNARHLLVLFASLAVNVSLAMVCIYLLDVQIHLYSLAGLSISLGLVMDNAIVMLDHLRKKDYVRIFNALLGASLTTIAALMLVFWLPEEDKKNLWEFALIIALNLGVSLLVSLFFYTCFVSIIDPQAPQATEGGFWPGKKISPSGLREREVQGSGHTLPLAFQYSGHFAFWFARFFVA